MRDRRASLEHAVDDRFAVLRFTDLEVGRLGGRLDEVAGGVDVEQARWLAGDLAAKNETGAELDAEGFKRVGIAQEHLAQGIADMAGGLEEIGHVHQRRSLAVGPDRFLQHRDERLRDRQVAGTQEHDGALAGLLEDRHLAEGADLVDAGVGARVGEENDALVEEHADAISHWCSVARKVEECCPARSIARRRWWRYCCCMARKASGVSVTSTFTLSFSPLPPLRMPRTGPASR